MSLNTFRYQIVYAVLDKSNAVIHQAVEVLPDGTTPPDFRVGDPWRVERQSGGFIEGKVSSSTRKLIFTDARNWLVQYDFQITEV
ncbi:MAG: hypothetical protein GC146_04530 [Limimaricola sp.]|uniref:hypothetical protein n=1 Tax=Limimaricola sp. TaxID=2211665 RepID=UPI001DA69743|nr:hypothetical protein [Limimaricola sp.]MBI1416470.1 hypothetical protein [Limimaricola sp.]